MLKLNNKLENIYKQGFCGGVAGVSPARRGSGQATKRREVALLAGALRGATCLGARGRPSPPL